MKWLLILVFMYSFPSFAQYPFEKNTAIKYIKTPFKIIKGKTDYSDIATVQYKDYRIDFLEKRLKDSTNLLLYFKGKLIKKVNSDFLVGTAIDEPLYVADINGDGLIDFKITFGNASAGGLASSRMNNIYLFNKGNNTFNVIYFSDFFPHDEYQFNNDGKYEIIGQRLVTYKHHAYWIFDLYNYQNGQLVNVSKKYGYPIAIQYLERENFIVSRKIPKKQLEKFSLKYPEFYTLNN